MGIEERGRALSSRFARLLASLLHYPNAWNRLALSMDARPTGHKESRNMAEETTSSDLEVVKLTTEDIPGAFIENESEVGKWIVDKRKFCRRHLYLFLAQRYQNTK